jgi:Lrp/AsnC family transcriptional regulator, leucine-responsive regulatory protein
MARMELDRFDFAILDILQKDNMTPQRLIGESVGLSAPAVQRRIKALERSGVIEGHSANLSPAAVGKPITLIVAVEIENESSAMIDAAKLLFAQTPEVQQCYYVTGETDFILIILVADMASYEVLTRRLFFANSNVKRFRTFVAMDRVKTGTIMSLDQRTWS